MDKSIKALFLAASLVTTSAFADNFILSSKLRFDYFSPHFITHNGSYLLIKYKDWSFSHENIEPDKFYSTVDISGYERDFLRAGYDTKYRSKLPKKLTAVSKEFTKGLNNKPDTIKHYKIGDAEILTGHDGKNSGQIYIMEELAIHQIVVNGEKKYLDLILKNIKER